MTDDNELGRIVTREDGHVLLIGIDRPKKYNGFTNKMLNELAQAYTEYENGPWRCALVYTSGPRLLALPNDRLAQALGGAVE